MLRSTRPPLLLALAFVFLLIPSSLHAWSREGHEIVAMIAEPRLHPDVRDSVGALLEGPTFIKAASWADKVRNQQTAPWHYVNIDLMDTEYDAARDCPQDECVIGQIERFRRVLAKADADTQKRQKALKYLIHLVGDLHQPLHVANNNDRGGNEVQVEFIGETIDPYSRKPWNLHAVWDSGILEVRDRDPRRVVKRLNAWLNTQPKGAFEDGSVVDWAMESHQIAKDHAYVLPEDRRLSEDYYRANVPVVDQQLAKAAVRLAKLLNDALEKK
ncbi:MAG TPA: S1/P1 nuclease [Nitrospiraceae bacterium]|nr:S1/P1 nuclease [Nitrospiraceae bacterium]